MDSILSPRRLILLQISILGVISDKSEARVELKCDYKTCLAEYEISCKILGSNSFPVLSKFFDELKGKIKIFDALRLSGGNKNLIWCT